MAKSNIVKKGGILILGAGPAGLACAMELWKAKKHFTVVEKDKLIGGLAKTHQFRKFRFDNGPHRFFSKNKYLYLFIDDLLHEKWIRVKRSTRFYVHGKFYRYPVDLLNVITTMEPIQLVRILKDYLSEQTKIWKRLQKPSHFEAYAVAQFGRALAEFNMLDYNQKLWGIPPNQMSVDWSTQRIKDLSLTEIAKKLLLKQSKAKSIVDEFFYPDFGTGMIYEKIKEKIGRDNTIHLSTTPTKIVHKNGTVTSVRLSNGKVYTPIDYLVTSIPITELVKLLDPLPPKTVLAAVKKLRYRSQVYVFLTINRPSITADQWIYFPDKDIPFARITEMKNFSKHMAPKNKTSLLVEYFCWQGDEVWNMPKKKLEKLTIDWLEKLNFLTKKDINETVLIHQANTYPVYDIAYNKYLTPVRNYVDSFKNIIAIGRPGRFKYTNQDHSLEMGILAAKSILENRKIDVENVGAEKEFFEKGKLR